MQRAVQHVAGGHGGEGIVAFTCRNPLASCTSDAIEKAEAPPPDGSHATKTWLTLPSGSRMLYSSRLGTRLIMASMASVPKAFSLPSAEMPSDSRKLPEEVAKVPKELWPKAWEGVARTA